MISRILSRLVVDPCIRRGYVPSKGIVAEWFGRLAASRIIRVKHSHPLFPLLSRGEWKTSFSFSDHSLMWLWSFLQATRPKAILEMGSGMSTLATALYAEECGAANRPVVVSLDHDQGWLDQTRGRCQELGVGSNIEFILAEIGALELPEEFGQVQGYAFDLDLVCKKVGSPDLVLIDGPPSNVGRVGTLPSILPLMKKDATVLLDDAKRPEERAAIEKWVEHGRGTLTHEATYPLGKGLGRLTFEPDFAK